MKQLLALARADVAMYLSNRRAMLVTLAAPILIAAFFGLVLGGAPEKPTKVPLAVTDLDVSTVSKRIVAAMKGDATFELQELDEPTAIAMVRKGTVRAAIVIPQGFGAAAGRSLFRPRLPRPQIAVHYDPSQRITLSLVNGLLAQHVMQAVSSEAFGSAGGSALRGDVRKDIEASATLATEAKKDLLSILDSVDRLQATGQGPDGAAGAATQGLSLPFETKEHEVTSGAGRKYNAYAHAFAGMSVQFVLFMGIELGMAVLLMRRQGIWKRLRAAPLSRSTLLGSRIVSGTVIALALLAGIYAAAIAFFGVRIEGSLAGFVAISLTFALLAATFGLLIAALGRTPEATRGIAIVATLLLVMLGGAWVPTFVFPQWLQDAALIVPTRWAIDGLEAMTWRGLGFEAALAPSGVLLAFSAVFALIAMKRFAWEE
jgi:ABC-2 type transport system permease protein